VFIQYLKGKEKASKPSPVDLCFCGLCSKFGHISVHYFAYLVAELLISAMLCCLELAIEFGERVPRDNFKKLPTAFVKATNRQGNSGAIDFSIDYL
jgi:hypothetical protein